jgi:uncharacterized protein (TIGR02145 family)
MKTNLFRKNHPSSKGGMRIMRLALLLLPLLGRGLEGGCVLFAQNGVTVSGLAISAGTVTFNVSWQTPMPVALWSDTVWVFVGYNNAGKMERLPLLPGAILTATSPGGKVIEETNNNKGVWVVGNARDAGAFSATVKLLTEVKDVGGACVYGSNYPPVGKYSSDTPMLSFTGTPMYDIQLAKPGGGSVTVKSGDTFLLPCDYAPTSFTDATGAPGRLNGTPFNGSVPHYAASTKTWAVKSQIWSDVINIPECDRDAFTNSNTVPYCRSYVVNGKRWFYYNWTYVNENQNTLCPSPWWRVPTNDDFKALDVALGGTGNGRSVAPSWVTSTYIATWGATYIGAADNTYGGFIHVNTGAFYWSSTVRPAGSGFFLAIWNDGSVRPSYIEDHYIGISVRCIRTL